MARGNKKNGQPKAPVANTASEASVPAAPAASPSSERSPQSTPEPPAPTRSTSSSSVGSTERSISPRLSVSSGGEPSIRDKNNLAHATALKTQQIAKLKILLSEKRAKHGTVSRDHSIKKDRLTTVRKNHTHDKKKEVCVDEKGSSVARLEVEVKQGKDLPKMDWYSGKCDPYITLSISPLAACADKTDKRTKVKPRERSPAFNQMFTFQPIEFKKCDLVLNVMDAENFGNDDFMGKVTIPLTSVDTQDWVEAWYPLTDPEKKSEAKHLSGSLLIRTKFIHSERLKLESDIKAHTSYIDKLSKDIKKIVTHINRLEGKDVGNVADPDAVWLFADFDEEIPLLFTDIEHVNQEGQTGGVPVSKHDICSVM